MLLMSLFLRSGSMYLAFCALVTATLEVEGLELAWLHTLESGFGIQANALC